MLAIAKTKEDFAMAMNRIQFQKSLSFPEFQKLYGTKEQCEAVLEKARWPHGFVCPHCKCPDYYIAWHGTVKTFQCKQCAIQTSLTAGTIFHASKLPLTSWFLAMYLMTQSKNSISCMELMRMLGASYPAVWRLKHKLMQVMLEREEKTLLSGRVELDDAYLGGEEHGGKRGRGSENKVPFLAAISTDDEGHPKYAVLTPVKGFTTADVTEWSAKHLYKTAKVVSDGLACFHAVTTAGCQHEPQIVGKERKSTGMGCFNRINTLLGNIKTSFSGTLHAFDFEKYAGRYLAEVQYRFNRRFEMATMLIRLVYASIQTGKRTEAWLRRTSEASC